MKRVLVFAVGLSVLGILTATESWAQGGPRWQGSGGWGPHGAYMKLYDPQTVESITGEIVKVDVLPMRGMSGGVQLTLKTEKETIPVHLGPSWYLERQDLKLAPKYKVEIKGSRVMFNGKAAVIAAEVKKGDETLVLRDETGFPAWSAMRRR
jgi:hypothetical protein